MNALEYHATSDPPPGGFPVKIPPAWRSRVQACPDGPLGRQVLPGPGEGEPDVGDLVDPVGEARHRVAPLVVRKHADRVLLLTTRRCFVHCRYCFRRGLDELEPTRAERLDAASFAVRSGAEEAILSGGDPLTLPDPELAALLDALAGVPVVRVHTRSPVVAPERVTPALVRLLREHAPLWVVMSANHADELDAAATAAIARLVDAGVPVLNQAVLLRGVNDRVEDQVELARALVRRRVRPYYLHHTDRAAGNAHLRVSLAEGLALHAALRGRVSGLALPAYVIDAPDGSGKVPVAEWVACHNAPEESP